MVMTTTRRAMWFGLAAALSCGSVSVAASDGFQGGPAGLVETVQRAVERYRDPADADAQGWKSANACVSGPEEGAMGVHFVNFALVDGKPEVKSPEALIYEVKNGRARLVGVEYIVPVAAWNPAAGEPPVPVLEGQVFHFNDSPNRFGLPAFYELHVWAWRDNPNGAFADWNTGVSCEGR